MAHRNDALKNVPDGDKKTKFHVPTGPSKETGPRSVNVPDGNYLVRCIDARYRAKRKDGTRYDRPQVEAWWEAFDVGEKSLGKFMCQHSLPIPKDANDDVSGSEKFWSIMGRSFAEFEGKEEVYFEQDSVPFSPAWMEGKAGWARLENRPSTAGTRLYTNIKWFMSKAEYLAAPGEATGSGKTPPPPMTDEAPEVMGEEIIDSDIPF